VSVRIAELRPLYVLGDVRLPGPTHSVTAAGTKRAVAHAGGSAPATAAEHRRFEFLLAEGACIS
jgi:polysaccharide export outer membrane protein